MTRLEYIDAVAVFARDYINDPNERTNERNALLVQAASVVLGRQLNGCTTCYAEVALLIYNKSKMEQSNYVMRHGAILVLEVFSRADLAMTVHNTTDDLAELHLGLKPHEIVYFSEFPKEENGEFFGVTAQRLAELKAKFDVTTVYETEVKGIVNLEPIVEETDPVVEDVIEPAKESTIELIGAGGKKVGKK